MTVKWDVVRALKESGLPGPVRQVIRLILDEVDANTCRTTDAHPVSIGKLEKWSGLGRSTVIRALDTAEETCWLERDRPETREALGEFATTHYHVMIGKTVVKEKRKRPSSPSATAGLGPEEDHPSAGAELGDEPSARAGLGSERDQGSATEGLGVVPERDHPSARAGHIIQPPTGVESHHSHQSPLSPLASPPSAGAAGAPPLPGFETTEQAPAKPKRTRTTEAAASSSPKEPTEGQRVNALAKRYTNIVKLSKFEAVAGVVRAAVRTGDYTDEQIATALDQLAAPETRRTVTKETLRIAIEGFPKSSNAKPDWRIVEDQDYSEWDPKGTAQ